ncbi:diguanylate cyclase [Pseudohongiella spirulinae]|uniref:diguanylate cyclase n=1 Tax=Pseudohongiella spirulinae TaxID=1249552 RepID=A0A0S2KCG1_9GAMM|nr:diguanylate cyclase [Pseudohongiella spirulinae]ALO46007.1 diguanylate cyclase [Pseudohongiella spirulinae]
MPDIDSITDNPADGMQRLHLIMQLLQTLDNGLILLDRDHNIQLWNSFMENHSGISTSDARNRNLFELFPDLPQAWLKRKIESVFKLQSRTFCTWEEHPRLFNFKSTRPMTGHSAKMYQNITFIPLHGLDKTVNQVCLLVYDVTEIATRKKELESANESLRLVSRTDGLTKLYNRAYWEECLKLEFQRSQRSGRPASLILLDIDHFKTFNDTHGHQAGDQALRMVGQLLQKFRRATDTAGRYGGEEFGIILPETTVEQAKIFAERLRLKIATSDVIWDGESLALSISIGISALQADMNTHQDWIEASDNALYQSKAAGRNRVSVAGDSAE